MHQPPEEQRSTFRLDVPLHQLLTTYRPATDWNPHGITPAILGSNLAFGAIANAYYPKVNRGPGLLSRIFAMDLSAKVVNGVLQELVRRKLTPGVGDRN